MTRRWSGEWWAQRRKGIIAATGALATVAVTLYGPTSDIGKAATAVIAVLTALGVYGVPNLPMPVVDKRQGKHMLRETDAYPDDWYDRT